MNNFVQPLLGSILLGINTCFDFLYKIPLVKRGFDICHPYLLGVTYNLLFWYSKCEIILVKLLPKSRSNEYLSLYCLEQNKFIENNKEIKKILSDGSRKFRYILKFKKKDNIGRLYINNNKIINSLDDIEVKTDNSVLSAILKIKSNKLILEKDITKLLNEYLVCNFDENFKLLDMIDDSSKIFDDTARIHLVDSLAEEYIWDKDTLI